MVDIGKILILRRPTSSFDVQMFMLMLEQMRIQNSLFTALVSHFVPVQCSPNTNVVQY